MAGPARPFLVGHPKAGGRARGTPNKATLAARQLAEQFIADPVYRQHLKARLIAGTAHPAIEQMMWAYAFGRPTEQIDLSGSVHMRDVSKLSEDELMAELEAQQTAIAALLSDRHTARDT